MQININTQGNETVAILIGRLDTPASIELAEQFDILAGKAGGTVVLDCSQLE